MRRFLLFPLLCAALAACSAPMQKPTQADLAQQVADTERAFAKTMADRDHAAFAAFLSEEAIFFTGPAPLRGKAAVAAGWKRFYESPKAPFSWRPETVEVLDSGTLALSSGPVFDPAGKKIATFTSIWRQEAPGVWRIVLDKGNPECECGSKT
ncbi:MAG: nuclear transport factor 2 family protein [Burkholderiales bacterium]